MHSKQKGSVGRREAALPLPQSKKGRRQAGLERGAVLTVVWLQQHSDQLCTTAQQE